MANPAIITITPKKGATIKDCCSLAKEISETIESEIIFHFNNVEITTKNMSITEMVNSYLTQR